MGMADYSSSSCTQFAFVACSPLFFFGLRLCCSTLPSVATWRWSGIQNVGLLSSKIRVWCRAAAVGLRFLLLALELYTRTAVPVLYGSFFKQAGERASLLLAVCCGTPRNARPPETSASTVSYCCCRRVIKVQVKVLLVLYAVKAMDAGFNAQTAKQPNCECT